MMLGGGMMLGIGLLMMFIVLGLPILLVVGMMAVLMGLWNRRPGPASPACFCAHCGQSLQADWTHCPKCGAPVDVK